MDSKSSLLDLFTNKKILICCGPGGVGKTTTSAALALCAARLGKKTAVITIDPSQRLITSLGINLEKDMESFDLTTHLHQFMTDIEKQKSGTLLAIVPKAQKTFEDLFRRLAPADSPILGKILKTSIFKIFAKEYSGAHEYMAMERLYKLTEKLKTGELDFIILDTPPSLNTKFFLDAPNLLLNFFDESLVHFFSNPKGKLLSLGIKKLSQTFENLTGQGFFSDLIEFSSTVYLLRSQFLENLNKISEIFQSDEVTFVGVSTPERIEEKDALDFVNFIKMKNYSFWGFIMNRSLQERYQQFYQNPNADADLWSKEIELFLSFQELHIVKEMHNRLVLKSQKEEESKKYFSHLQAHTYYVAEQLSDVYSLEALYEFSKNFMV